MKQTAYTQFPTLAAAVAFAKPDLSYNPGEAQRKIESFDNPAPRFADVKLNRALVLENGEVWTETEYKGIRYLAKFDAFMSVLDDSPLCEVADDGRTLTFGKPMFRKCKTFRQVFAGKGLLFA